MASRNKRRITAAVAGALLAAALAPPATLALAHPTAPRCDAASSDHRRAVLSRLLRGSAAAAAAAAAATTVLATGTLPVAADSPPPTTIYSTAAPLASLDYPDPQYITTVLLDSPAARAGAELVDVMIGKPPRTVAAVKSLSPDGEASKQGVAPGMVLLKFADSSAVKGRLKSGPYPVVLQFYNLAGDTGGDGLSAQDALLIAEERSAEPAKALDVYGNRLGGLDVRVVKKAEAPCGDSKSKRGDIMEVKYEARIGGRDGILYDSSDESGLGRYMLGKGEVVQGVDVGTFDMCVGEIREIEIPSALAYGGRGNQLYLIPPGSRLWWRVELVGKQR